VARISVAKGYTRSRGGAPQRRRAFHLKNSTAGIAADPSSACRPWVIIAERGRLPAPDRRSLVRRDRVAESSGRSFAEAVPHVPKPCREPCRDDRSGSGTRRV